MDDNNNTFDTFNDERQFDLDIERYLIFVPGKSPV